MTQQGPAYNVAQADILTVGKGWPIAGLADVWRSRYSSRPPDAVVAEAPSNHHRQRYRHPRRPSPPILPPVTGAWHVPDLQLRHRRGARHVLRPTAVCTAHRSNARRPNYFTYGVAALAAGSTLAAIVGTTTTEHNAEIYFSTDAGCSWQPSGQTLPDVYYYLTPR